MAMIMIRKLSPEAAFRVITFVRPESLPKKRLK